MSLHPCVTLQRYRNARFSIRDTAYRAVLRDAQLHEPRDAKTPRSGGGGAPSWLRRMESNHRKLVYETNVNTNSLRRIVPFHFQTDNAVGTLDWNHGAESNCHCILSAACGSLTAAHLLALQCRTAIVRPWYKMAVITTIIPWGFVRTRLLRGRPLMPAITDPPQFVITRDGNRTRVSALKGRRTYPYATPSYICREATAPYFLPPPYMSIGPRRSPS